MLRLKASYGETGAASGALETDAYTYYKYVSDNRYMNWMGAQLGGFGNPNLTWQTTKEMNIGTEFGLLDNRIKGSLMSIPRRPTTFCLPWTFLSPWAFLLIVPT